MFNSSDSPIDRSNMGLNTSRSPDNPVPLDLGADRPDSVNFLLRSQVRGDQPHSTLGSIYYPGCHLNEPYDEAKGPIRGGKTGPKSPRVQSTIYPMTPVQRRLCIGRGRGRKISTDQAQSNSVSII